MKSLSESLFDRDLIGKDIKFGDIYEPYWITSTTSDSPFKKITNMFNMGKLRKAYKPLNLSNVKRNGHYDESYIEVIELIVGAVSNMPLKEKIDYDKDIDKLFESFARSPYWKRGITILMGESSRFNIVSLYITRSNMSEYTNITINFKKK